MLGWGVDSRGQDTVRRPFERLCKNPHKISGGLDQENRSMGGERKWISEHIFS